MSVRLDTLEDAIKALTKATEALAKAKDTEPPAKLDEGKSEDEGDEGDSDCKEDEDAEDGDKAEEKMAKLAERVAQLESIPDRGTVETPEGEAKTTTDGSEQIMEHLRQKQEASR